MTSKKINYLQNEKHKHGNKQNHKVVIIHHTNVHVRKYLVLTFCFVKHKQKCGDWKLCKQLKKSPVDQKEQVRTK